MSNLFAQPSAIFRLVVAVLLTLPWLNPFAPGPSPAVSPWLFSTFISISVLLIFEFRRKVLAFDAGPPLSGVAQAFSGALLASGLISSVFALIQYADFEVWFAPFINATEPAYAFANLRQRNQLASLTSMSLAVLLAWAMCGKHVACKSGVGAAALAGVALLAIGNAASGSRTGLVQIFLLWLIFLLWGGWRVSLVRWSLVCAVMAYAVAAVVLPYSLGFDPSTQGLFARLQVGDSPCTSRVTLWSNVLHLIAEKPWLGWGWGELDYAHFVTLYEEPRFCDILDNAHNLPLHLAVELGVPVSVLVCAASTLWAVRRKPWAEVDPTRQMAWAVLAMILLHSMLEYPLWYGPFQMAFGACVFLLWRQKLPSEFKNDSKQASSWPLGHTFRAQIALVLIAFIGYSAFDYHRISQIYMPPASRAAAYQTDTLNKIRGSWLFVDQVQFAELLTTSLTPANAEWTFNTAGQLLHYSPEPKVIEKLIESAVLLGRDDDALAYLVRFRAAFPKEHLLWANAQTKHL